MDTKDFVAWAMSPERTVEERFGVERAIEWGIDIYRAERKLPARHNWEQKKEIQTARRLNPAYEPRLNAEEVRQGAEGLRLRKEYWQPSYQDRPVRDLGWLRFFPHVTDVSLSEVQVDDYSPLAALPNLRKLAINDDQALDLRPIGRCVHLEQLSVHLRQPWVKVDGLERLEKLECIDWHGSPLMLQAIPRWPSVRRASLRGGYGLDFPLRDALQLPEMPLLEDLKLESIFSLEGLERYPRLVTLHLAGSFREVTPLAACRALTHLWLELSIHLHLDVLRDPAPLARLPELRFLHVHSQRPRDYSALVESPHLHEVQLMASLNEPLTACQMEMNALHAALEPWDVEFLAPSARPVPPLRVKFADPQKHNQLPELEPLPGPPPEWEQDRGFRQSEGRWLANRLSKRLAALLADDEHWGTVEKFAFNTSSVLNPFRQRSISVVIKSQDAAERLREIIGLIRRELASLRTRWQVWLRIDLELPPVNDPRLMAEIERLREQADDAYRERRRQEEAEFLERQHRLELQKESGGKVRPEDFAAADAPEETDGETDDDDDANEGDTASAELRELFDQFDPDRPHPLADQYQLQIYIREEVCWSFEMCRDAVTFLLGSEP